ncbi:YcxB family protein [Streptomyces sp. NPDC055815]
MDTRDAAVTFVYEPTEADYRAAVRRLRFGTWRGLGGVAVLLVVAELLASYRAWRGGFSPAGVTVWAACLLVVLVAVVHWATGRLARRQFDGMDAYGTCRTVVGPQGMTTTGGELSSDLDWQAFPWYVETSELFVLRTRRTGLVFVLPKRGAQDPADVDRVREVLEGSLHRLRSMPGMTARR